MSEVTALPTEPHQCPICVSVTRRLLHQGFRLQDGRGELEACAVVLVLHRAQDQKVGLPLALHDEQAGSH